MLTLVSLGTAALTAIATECGASATALAGGFALGALGATIAKQNK